MKNLFTLVLLLELILVGGTVTSCSNSNARLAKDLTGVWQGTPETFSDATAITATIIDSYMFSPGTKTETGAISGTITVNGMVTTTTQIVGDSAMIEPLSLSASGRTTISGTWTVIDDDEISISFDPQTLSVVIDSDAIVANETIVSDAQPELEALRPALIKTLTQGVHQALAARYARVNHWDDIKIKGNLLKYEIGHDDFVLTKDTSNQ